MNYYPKTIKKDPLHNWKEVEKYRDNNKGRLPTEPTIKERDIRLLIDELGFEWHSVRTWIFERAYGVEKIRFTISQSRTQKDHWMFT
ncbi:MAG TPA: hypothetical protein PLS50_08740, partial [Candidatus Dojkabacteria bacterium]|nr:hypothetical protein [Candidatus Dojkabacteria bacterium]